MKKGRRAALAAIGVPLLVSGVVILDAWLRAGSVITAHEIRLAADIAALRLRQKPSPLILPEHVRNDPRFAYEEGHTGQTKTWEALSPVIQLPMETADELLESLARCQEIFLENGLLLGPRRYAFENLFLRRLRELLGTGLDGAPRLRRVATLLGHLDARRVEGAELLTGEHNLDRAEILNALQKGDPSLGKPGWRELYSRRLLAAKRLNHLEERRSQEPDVPGELRHDERRNRAQWTLTRAAIGVMIHHRENGSLPEEMNGLRLSGGLLQVEGTSLEWTFPSH